MATLFTADPHIGHDNIIKHCNRPFASVEEMDETIVERWNSVVGKRDTVRVIGDLAFHCKFDYALSVVKRLNGHIYLTPGNHEQLGLKLAFHAAFTVAPLYEVIEIEGQTIFLNHYAQRSWWHDLRGVWHLFGHTHGGLPPFGKSFDIGMDVWNFTPVSFEQVKEAMDKLPIGPHPGFAEYVPGQETV